jgi:hypothetical protein
LEFRDERRMGTDAELYIGSDIKSEEIANLCTRKY